ncbi:MAG: tRNA (adenosine(37)-N6)-threonylcarbamoyltransferase complex dimerization subunit type 1 TsaB [Alphaproteobacteria bacterium]|nr:tRNA (adenosine(37)-N6)-threonylcarbamoyltransferase complex dimerization subunit type 1 TsaB [Alphaproteobacteria bacterium]
MESQIEKSLSILAIDTSGKACSMAFWEQDEVKSSFFEIMNRGHSEILIPTIQKIIIKAKRDYKDIDWLAINLGPGSFTGVRIGLAAVKGLSIAADKPIYGIDSFNAWLAPLKVGLYSLKTSVSDKIFWVVLNNGIGQLYIQSFDQKFNSLLAPILIRPEEFTTYLISSQFFVIIGDGIPLIKPFIKKDNIFFVDDYHYPNASHWVTFIAAQLKTQVPSIGISPIYLRQKYKDV